MVFARLICHYFFTVFFVEVFFTAAFFTPHFEPQAIDHHPLPPETAITSKP
jgi:CRISPR/Cas system-associated protein Cas5 (RAMP superfamily)